MKIMKASELRLGNWVEQPNEGVTKVTSILNDLQIITETEYVDNYCRPIPLTEEWLLRFGFTYKKTDKANCYTLHFFSVNFVTDGRYKGKVFIRVANFNPDINNFLYVHQLQNLYHALTGEELTIIK
jgi:hypothetical protein